MPYDETIRSDIIQHPNKKELKIFCSTDIIYGVIRLKLLRQLVAKGRQTEKENPKMQINNYNGNMECK